MLLTEKDISKMTVAKFLANDRIPDIYPVVKPSGPLGLGMYKGTLRMLLEAKWKRDKLKRSKNV